MYWLLFLIEVLLSCVTSRVYAPPLSSTLGCCLCPNHHHHHYGVNHLPNSRVLFLMVLLLVLYTETWNSHHYTDWCPVMMHCFAINQETFDWSRFRTEILKVGCLKTISIYILFGCRYGVV